MILSAAVVALGPVGVVVSVGTAASAQPAPAVPATLPAAAPGATPELKGRTVEDVRIVGNTTVPTASIRNLIRTRAGDKYDPQTVEEDYQRIYRELRKFYNVTARAEPTATGGVVVVFEVEEQKQVNSRSDEETRSHGSPRFRSALRTLVDPRRRP